MKVRRLVLLVAAALLTSACGAAPTAQGGFVGGDGSLTIVPVAERKPAPRIVGTTLEGGSFDSAATTGSVVVYNVWGSWCAPCRKEAPALEAAAKRTAAKARFVGINTRDLDQAPAKAFQRSFGVTYPSVYDPDGRLLLLFGSHLPPSAIPSTLVVDAQGRVAARILGEVTESTIVGIVEDVAAGS